jgi:uncharacterized protein YuzE
VAVVTVLDVDGRAVDLTEERSAHIIGSDPHRVGHPQLARYRAEVMRAVQAPDPRLPGRRAGEEWFYLEGAGPRRFLKVVVAYHWGSRTCDHRVRPPLCAMTIRVANTDFDRVDYDAEADVVYLASGDPSRAVDFDETPEGHAVRYGSDGHIVGITIVNARRLLDQNGSIRITLPETISAADLGPALAGA